LEDGQPDPPADPPVSWPADLIDRDHANRTRYEAIAKAAGVVAARATAEELVAGRPWQVDGADLLPPAYAFHAGLARQAATAAHRRHAAGSGRGAAAADGAAVGDLPGLTGTALVLNARMGEQQRPQQVTSGLLQGLRSRLPVLALAGTGLWVRLRSRGTPTR
jgi:hypothetical protein